MSDAMITTATPVRRINLDWLPSVFFTPRQVFKQIAGQTRSVWLTPLLFMTLSALVRLISGLYPALRAATLVPVTALKYE
jgi:ABC-type lipoprotein release transport system permease subunit